MAKKLIATEYVSSTRPFTVRRRVRWSECDPAGVVFAGNFSIYLHNAVALFRTEMLGGFAAPTKAISLVFHRALWPDEEFDMAVYVSAVRNSTIEFRVIATVSKSKGEKVFDGTVTAIFIKKSERKAAPIPVATRRLAEAYAKRCPVPA